MTISRAAFTALLLSGLMLAAPTYAAAQEAAPAAAERRALPTPEQFFGFRMGEDRKLAGWDRLLEYYRLLARGSDRLRLVELGKSSEGRPFIALFISSPQNLADLERYRGINARLADPRGLDEATARRLATEGKAVIVQSFALHSSEVAAAQTAAEFVHDSLVREDAEAARMREEVISIVLPSINPDGTQMIADWYMKHVGTQYEAVGLPWLYQTYSGHDNNRDGFALNLPESQSVARLMYREWMPQAYVDHHQMGFSSARMSIPPYAEPIRPDADPLVWREMAMYGAHMGSRLEAAGKTGVIGAAIYSGWGHMGFHWITPFHNIAGMLTESASARYATPLYVHPEQLEGGDRALPEYASQVTMPSVWPGGWWRVRDIVEQQKIAAWATVDAAARSREDVLWNMYLKGRRQTERGAAGETKAYVIETAQHDPPTVRKLVNMLMASGVEVRQARAAFVADGRAYDAGSFVVSMAQPKQGLVRWMLGRTFYPDNSYTRDGNGDPIPPYDLATDTFGEFMGVRSDPVGAPVAAELAVLAAPLPTAGGVAPAGAGGHRLSGRLNDSYRAVFLLLGQGAQVRRVPADAGTAATEGTAAAGGPEAGDFIVSGASAALLADVAGRTGVDFAAYDGPAQAQARPLRKPRIGLFQRYNGGNIDEGWTRLMFEQFDVPFQSLRDARILKGRLEADYDVIVLPADSLRAMTGARTEGEGGRERTQPPPEYRSGFGDAGVAALQAFVRNGGTLVAFGEAGELPIQRFGLPVRDAVAGLPPKQFWAPGSTLHTRFDPRHPVAYGMPEAGLALYKNGQVYEVTSFQNGQDVEVFARYADRDLLQSGWLLGEKAIAGKPAAVLVRHGEGRVVLFGFRPQHRDQTHGTFKLVFNSLLLQ